MRLLLLGVTLSGALILGSLWLDLDAARPVRAIINGAGLAIGLGFSYLYWLRIDEAAKEAQKSAWLSGGCVALAILLVVATAASDRVIGAVINAEPRLNAPTFWFALGIEAAVAAQVVGFTVAWAIWWWRKR